MASPVATVAVYQKENGGFFVEPPAILVSTGHDLRLVNATNFAVTVTIRNRPQTPIGAHSDGPVTIPTNVRLFYPHPYRIDVGGMQAFGNSDPVIIIDR